MCVLTDVQKSQLRRKYEILDRRHQRALGYSGLREITTQEILHIFAENDADPQRWQTFTDLDGYLKNIATVRALGGRASL
jgi:hypothetical protein